MSYLSIETLGYSVVNSTIHRFNPTPADWGNKGTKSYHFRILNDKKYVFSQQKHKTYPKGCSEALLTLEIGINAKLSKAKTTACHQQKRLSQKREKKSIFQLQVKFFRKILKKRPSSLVYKKFTPWEFETTFDVAKLYIGHCVKKALLWILTIECFQISSYNWKFLAKILWQKPFLLLTNFPTKHFSKKISRDLQSSWSW